MKHQAGEEAESRSVCLDERAVSLAKGLAPAA